MNRLNEDTAENLEKLIRKVDDALKNWAENKQIFSSKEEGHNAAEFELRCDKRGDGTYISITVPETVGYFPLNDSLLKFIDALDSDEKLIELSKSSNKGQNWTLYKNQSAEDLEHEWKSENCIEIAHCGIPGIWSDPETNDIQKEFLERVLEILEDLD